PDRESRCRWQGSGSRAKHCHWRARNGQSESVARRKSGRLPRTMRSRTKRSARERRSGLLLTHPAAEWARTFRVPQSKILAAERFDAIRIVAVVVVAILT